MNVDAGRVLVADGTLGREAFVVIEGKAVVTRHDGFVAEFGPGDVFGELAVQGTRWRNATVTAVSSMTLLVLTPGEFDALVEDRPGFARALLHTVADRLGPPASAPSPRAGWSVSTGPWTLPSHTDLIAPLPPVSFDRFEERDR